MPDALIIIDIQNDYFPGGAFELEGADAAAANAALALGLFRERGWPVVHVRHESSAPGSAFLLPGTPGAAIHPLVAPLPAEPVITKHFPNSFRDTGLDELLRGQGDSALNVGGLVVCGMMSLMCVDSTVRAAFDLGWEVTLLHDACAARALEHGGALVPAAQVHAAFMAALGLRFATLAATAELLRRTGAP
ncbi:MAG: cysteine hydrolase family protein [Desulfovibrionaceae bacterium]